MGVLVIREKGNSDPVSAAYTGTTGFSSPTDDVTCDRKCRVVAVDILVPAGETFDLVKETAAGNDVPFITGATSGPYNLGEDYPLHPGEKLKPATNNVQSGAREFVIHAERW